MVPSDCNMLDSFDGFCSLWLEGVGWGVCILYQPFSKMLLMYYFYIISNLFDSDKPCALSTHNRKCANKIYHIWQNAQNYGVKKFYQNLPENYLKRTKIAITACKFSIFFRRSMSPDSLASSLLLNQLQLCSAEKNTFKKNAEIMPPSPPFEISRYTPLFTLDNCLHVYTCNMEHCVKNQIFIIPAVLRRSVLRVHGEVHLPGLALGRHSSEEISQR